ncbi:chitooligosaccharide deacetylase [Actinoplanes sp. NBRC 14428]|uniref:Polysaccharide deacetylase n=1 Tax=Pseudosporangium ferrugineum TaxID=439699 RepID=A0A2T0SIQ6_9ACTN|nr:polysaccharide deacetylase family protein [Pseudosporangium ferrugineum]PRY33292.1 polysaccharide deacetylase [Pseudosporangium ferrugineum]BCJ48710.1 chitooligosaccharide deacetylase [Actinoplanes sp. NBRC 14428]
MSILRTLTAVTAALVLAGCSAGDGAGDEAGRGEAGRAGGAPSHSAAPGPSAGAPSGTRPDRQHDGWRDSDIPVFGPAPAAEKIALPPGGSVPYLLRIPTTQKVAFLTIDDGFLKHPEAPKLIAAARVPVTLFLTTNAIKDNPDYFRPMIAAGAVVESHTITHNNLRGKSYAFQKREICGSADRLAKWYDRRPVLFRPPFGNKDATTLRAAHDCGMKAAFMWKETVHKGKVRYQEGKRVKPGDIILMHFREAFVKDFLSALRAIHKAGLTPALLEDYI